MAHQNPEALNLVHKLMARWKAESPNFFKQVGNVSMVLAIITGLPELLVYFEVQVPPYLHNYLTDIILHASVTAKFITKLTVATPMTEEILVDIKEKGCSDLNKQ